MGEQDDKRLRCLLMLDEVPGGQFRAVRTPTGGLIGRLNRLEQKFLRRVRPEIGGFPNSSHVRGARVAVDYLLRALLGFSKRADFSLLVADNRRSEFEEWAANYRDGDARRVTAIYPATSLAGPGRQVGEPDIWLNLYGDLDFSLKIRDRLFDHPYPTVSVMHGLSNQSLLYERFLRTLLTPTHACDSIVCSSEACRKAVSNILEGVATAFHDQFGLQIAFRGRLDVIPLCVDTDQLTPQDKRYVRRQVRIPQDAFVFLYVGYISQVKADLVPLLSIMRELVEHHRDKDLRLVVLGTGTDAYGSALQSVVRELELNKTVTFVREATDSVKAQYLSAADVFVAPCDSLQECFGLTPVEAMASGVPQVVADWSGYRETVVDGETGFLIPTVWGRCESDLRLTSEFFGWQYDHIVQGQSIAFDRAVMYRRLDALVCSPELRTAMAKRSRERAVSEFSCAVTARRYDELWTELADLAQHTRMCPHGKRFDEPLYFDYYGHFASRELVEGCILRSSDSTIPSLDTLVDLAHLELSSSNVFDKSLLRCLMDLLSKNAPRGITVREVFRDLGKQIWSTDVITRHILFLIKHGMAMVDGSV